MRISAGVIIFAATLFIHISLARGLANDEPNDGKMYAQIAVDLLQQNSFSIETEAPFPPTLIRLPGYPFFIAGIYAVFGTGNNEAVRVTQAVFDSLTCLLAAAIAGLWVKKGRRRRKAAWAAFLLAALCPFTAIYAATILTESLTTFLLAGMTLTATLAFRSQKTFPSICWWSLTGLICGLAVLLRPDSGLFAAGIGMTLALTGLFFRRDAEDTFFRRSLRTALQGGIFSIAFVIILIPWTIRNYQVFGVFQPLAPAHAEMPGEFVPHGYLNWVRTWIDDPRYIGPALWKIEDQRVEITEFPVSAFDSEEEKAKVAALLQQYNHPPDTDDDAAQSANEDDQNSADSDDQADDDSDSAADSADEQPEDDPTDVEMTPELDAGFQQIADERIAHDPPRYYFTLPAKRAAAMWFDTHSLYYPFGGELFPFKDLDTETGQHLWLPLFAALVWVYTLLAALGAVLLFRARKFGGGRGLLLIILMTLPRIIFFATLENLEPRYVVELFIFTAILGGISLACLEFRLKRRSAAIIFDLRPWF